MQATLALREKMAQLLAADTGTLAQAADPNHAVLLKAAFTPGEGVLMADLTPADFDGSTPLECELGTQEEGIDPNTGDAIITLGPPAGGWRWEVTGVTNLPQTIYGIAFTNEAETVLFAMLKFETPIPLSSVNQAINVGPLTLRQIAGSLT